MSTDIQVAFSFVSALDICLTSFGGAGIVGARNADHVDYGPLNPASLPLGLTLCHQDLPGELTDYQELTEFKGRATRSFVLGTRQMSITNRVSARIPKGNLDHNLRGIDPCLLTILSFDLCTCKGGEAIVASPQGIGTQGRSQGTSQFVGASSSGGAQTSVASRGGSQHKGRGGRFRATGRVYNMSQQEAQASLDVIIGILPVFGIPARVLIDPGATHSFVTPSFAHNANVRLSALRNELAISVTTGEIFQVGTVYRDSIVLVGDVFLEADLIPLGLVDLDVILNMDWLAKHHASVDCFRKERLEDISVVQEFPDVFPEDLPGLLISS
ncbi:hypothetical protein L3X38_004402 [Prunus dulcis]|uniref:Uncharacterized protein n=1 Tax=Prunus dulcis TaxID=3755 RepID=A0AAD5F332_PRUDU|nr:hypothetical protein L3X38_004402 [Prunus dulcis]